MPRDPLLCASPGPLAGRIFPPRRYRAVPSRLSLYRPAVPAFAARSAAMRLRSACRAAS